MRPLSYLTRSLSQRGAESALPRARADVDRLREQLATGLRIQRPSDDPSGFSRARALGRSEERLDQITRGLDLAELWVNRTQDEVDGVADLFAEAYESGLRAANGTLDMEPLAQQVESLRGEVIERLNAQSNGEYLFSGNRTRTAPLQADGSIAPGNFSGSRTREIGPNTTIGINVSGADALFVGGDPAPERLQALADAIRTGDGDTIRTALEGVGEGRDHFIDLGGSVGVIAKRIGTARSTLEAQTIYMAEARSSIEDADIVEVYGALERRQAGLEAALRATAASVQPSLMDYLR